MNTSVDEANDLPRPLSQDASDLLGRIQQLTGAASVDQQIRSLIPLLEGAVSLGSLFEELGQLSQLLTDAAEKGIEVDRPDCPVNPQEIAELANNARARDLDIGRCQVVASELGRARSDLVETLNDAWRTHCDDLLHGLDGWEGLTQALMEIEGLDGVTRIRTDVMKAISLKEHGFSTERADSFAGLAETIPPAIRGLIGGDEEVEEFLRTAVDVGVSLDDVPDSVLEWLNERNLLGSFRVVAGSPLQRSDL